MKIVESVVSAGGTGRPSADNKMMPPIESIPAAPGM